MTHYVVAVIVEETDDVEAAVETALAPFDENIDVEPYPILIPAAERRQMMESFGTPDFRPDTLLPYVKDWSGYPGQIGEDGELYKLSTYNPKSKWDWWVIGGRWSGYFNDCEDPDLNVYKVRDLPPRPMVTEEWKWDKKVRDLPKDEHYLKVPYALVTPDGEWVTQGRMGWWGMSDDEISDVDWGRKFVEILSAYPDYLIVNVDCHI